MPADASPRRTPARTARPADAAAVARTRRRADAAKRQRIAGLLKELRRDAEQLLANADRLLGRLS